jgi:parvulin-like peptidyl-prolyl isomerase
MSDATDTPRPLPLPRRRHAALGAVLAAAVLLAGALGMAIPAAAQSPFAVAARVNNDIVTNFEIQQRQRFLQLLNAPGEIVANARDALIDERLQTQAAERMGVLASAEDIEAGVAEFAARANMGPQQFVSALGQAGVSAESFRDFVAAGINWRNVVRARFAASARVSDDEVDRALARSGGTDVAAIDYATIPIVGGQSADALARAQRLRDRVDTCDDLYGVRPEGFERRVLPPAEIPADIGAALSRLDANEMSFEITRGGGTLLLVTMLCARSTEVPDEARAQVREQLFQRRMGAYASGYLEELRADAIIVMGGG